MKALLKNNQELIDFTGATTQIGLEDLAPYLTMSRPEREIKKLMGNSIYSDLITAYHADSLSTKQAALLPYAQKALALLAMLEYIREGHSQITSAGIHADRERSAFQWQQREVKQSYQEKAYFALDELGQYMLAHKDDFTGFTDTDTYKSLTRHLIQTPAQFNEYVNINESLRTLLAVRPILQHLEDIRLTSLCTPSVMADLRKQLRGEHDETRFKELIALLQPALAYLTMSEAITTLHLHLTADGALVFSLEQNSRNSEAAKPGDYNQLDMYMREFNRKGEAALDRAREYLNEKASETLFPTYYAAPHYEDPSAEPEEWKDDHKTINLM